MDPTSIGDWVTKFGLPLVMLGIVLWAFNGFLNKYISAAGEDKAAFKAMVDAKDQKLAEQHAWVRETFVDILTDCRSVLQSVAHALDRRDHGPTHPQEKG